MEDARMTKSSRLLAVTVLAAGAASFAAPAGAAPITASSSLREAAAPIVETVQWRYRRGWWGPGVAAGVVAGAAIAASQPYGYNYNAYDDYAYAPGYGSTPSYGYSYSPGYSYSSPGTSYSYAPGTSYSTSPGGSYAYSPGYNYSGGDQTAYCRQRFRSYDPASGTYLGYDGQRHPCP
jgi:hypothetical protein